MTGFELEQGEWVRVLTTQFQGEVVKVEEGEVVIALKPNGFRLRFDRELCVRATRPQTGWQARG